MDHEDRHEDADWIHALAAMARPEAPAVPEVRLVDYPVALGIRQQGRTADLMRECQLIELDRAHGPDDSSTPASLLTFAARLYETFGPALEEPRQPLERAMSQGVASIEQCYPLVPASAAMMLEYARLMEEADAYCRAGLLVNLEPDPQVYALRRWTVEEFVRQYAGLPPRPWGAAAAADQPAGEVPSRS